jgi:3-oxoacyl-[acyl-carrier protein] reductase
MNQRAQELQLELALHPLARQLLPRDGNGDAELDRALADVRRKIVVESPSSVVGPLAPQTERFGGAVQVIRVVGNQVRPPAAAPGDVRVVDVHGHRSRHHPASNRFPERGGGGCLTSERATLIKQVMEVDGRAALVTGGSRGIGRAVCLGLAADGLAVAVNYRSGKKQAEEVVAEIESGGGRAVAVAGDVSDYDQAQAIVQEAIEQLGGLHVLVNNAGIAKNALIFNMEPSDWLDVMRVNFGGVFNCTKAVMSHFMSQREGAINSFTRCAALELARFGIRVNAVLPGFAPTEMVSEIVAKDGGKPILRQIPLRTFPELDQVAAVIVFLAGPGASYMTGSLLVVDGGASTTVGVGAPLT